MRDFKKLMVWEKAHAFVLRIYRETKSFPGEEKYGIVNQLRKASVSIPANISEGCGKVSSVDFARFLQISMGSSCEVEYYLLLSCDLEFLDKKKYFKLYKDIEEIKKILASFIMKLKSDS